MGVYVGRCRDKSDVDISYSCNTSNRKEVIQLKFSVRSLLQRMYLFTIFMCNSFTTGGDVPGPATFP